MRHSASMSWCVFLMIRHTYHTQVPEHIKLVLIFHVIFSDMFHDIFAAYAILMIWSVNSVLPTLPLINPGITSNRVHAERDYFNILHGAVLMDHKEPGWGCIKGTEMNKRFMYLCLIQYKHHISRYRYSHYKDKMVWRPSYLYNGREREIQFIGLFEDRGHRGPYSPYKPFNHNLYIGIIIFPHIDNPQSTGYN